MQAIEMSDHGLAQLCDAAQRPPVAASWYDLGLNFQCIAGPT